MALMGGNEGAHQRQAEADAAELAAVLAVGLLERLEDARLVGGRDADALVAHPALDLAGLGAAAADPDRPARWRKFQRVAELVSQALPHHPPNGPQPRSDTWRDSVCTFVS